MAFRCAIRCAIRSPARAARSCAIERCHDRFCLGVPTCGHTSRDHVRKLLRNSTPGTSCRVPRRRSLANSGGRVRSSGAFDVCRLMDLRRCTKLAGREYFWQVPLPYQAAAHIFRSYRDIDGNVAAGIR